MTKYCPRCESEFFENITVCPDDGSILSDNRPTQQVATAAYDIYAASDEIEAERILTLLADNGIQASIYQSDVTIIPAKSNQHFMIAVPEKMRKEALSLIRNARQDGVISDLGIFI